MERRAPRKTAKTRKATTNEVLGKNPANEIDPRWRKYYDRLLTLRAELRKSKSRLVGGAKQQNTRYSQHMADAGTNSYEKDLALSQASAEQDTLFEIDAALDRITDGTYGNCEITGKLIEAARLEAIPWTRFSAEAEKELEEKGQIHTTKLGTPARIGRSSTENRLGETWTAEPQPREEGFDGKKSGAEKKRK